MRIAQACLAVAICLMLSSSCDLSELRRDKEAAVGGPRNGLATGSFSEVRIGDACGSGGKVGLCQTDEVMEQLLFESSDPSIIELLDASTLLPPTDIRVPLAMHALAPGSATIRARARFSDGTEREAANQVTVRSVSKVSLEPVCRQDAQGPFYVHCGARLTLSPVLWDGDMRLNGYLPDLLSGPGLERDPAAPLFSTYLLWQARACPTKSVITSRIDSAFSVTLSTFETGDVTEVTAVPRTSPPQYLLSPGIVAMDVRLLVGDKTTCTTLPGAARTQSPDVCTGRNGETEWSEDSVYGFAIRVQKEGTCKLVVGIKGEPLRYPVDVPVFFPNWTVHYATEYAGGGCDQEGMLSCDMNWASVLTCSKGTWKVAAQCGPDRVCDYPAAGSSACGGKSDCAQCRGLSGP